MTHKAKYLPLAGPKLTHATKVPVTANSRTLCGLGLKPMKLRLIRTTVINCPQCKAVVRKERAA